MPKNECHLHLLKVLRRPPFRRAFIKPGAAVNRNSFQTSSAGAALQNSPARSFGVEGKYQTILSVSKGGDCIDYKEEDPEIRQIFEKALAEEGIKSNMAPSLYA